MRYDFKTSHAILTLLLLLAAPICTLSGQEDVVARTADATPAKSETKTDDAPKEEVCKYEFTIEHSTEFTDVKSQGATGTCWSFATASFIESELMRREKGQHNLSEMFIVKNIYRDKALNYVLRQGKANFSEGALAHDFLKSAERYGLAPEEVYSGREDDQAKHDHGEMESVMLGFLDAVVKRKKLSNKWQIASDKILNTYLGETPERFTYRDRSYSPQEFAKSLEFRSEDYVSLTSYTHHPFYKPFILEIPDNFSNGSFQNLPIDDLIEIIDNAIENGYSVAWDGDVSEKGFSSKKGMAVLPKKADRKDLFINPGEELTVDQQMRQDAFMSLATTDDHLMHLVGISRDADGNKYYVVKNSWGLLGPHKGLIHMSEAFVRLKTVAVIVHKDAIPPKHQRD